MSNEERRNRNAPYNPVTIGEVQKRYSYIDWLAYINAMLPDGLEIDAKEEIIVSAPNFFSLLGHLLEQTPKQVIANYLMWRITDFSSTFMTEKLRERQRLYKTAIGERVEQEPRWRNCVRFTTER